MAEEITTEATIDEETKTASTALTGEIDFNKYNDDELEELVGQKLTLIEQR